MIKKRQIEWIESTDEQFCLKSTLKGIIEKLGKIKAALNLVDEEKEEQKNDFDNSSIKKFMNE